MYRNFCQAVLPLLFQVFYNFTIFFCVYARKRTFCVFIHKKRRKIVLLRKFLHKKIISRKGKIQRRNGGKLYLFLPPDGSRACLFPIFPRASDALSAEKRTMRTGFFFYISALLFFPFQQTRPRFQKAFCSPSANSFFRKRNRTDSTTGEKKGDTFFPLSVRDILSAECAATLSPAQNGCVIS